MVTATTTSPREGELTYPLSPLQQGMLAHHLRAPHSGVDIEQLVCSLPKRVDADVLRRAWETVVARHDILRTSFEWLERDVPQQRVERACRAGS
jgi:hypothetical protein